MGGTIRGETYTWGLDSSVVVACAQAVNGLNQSDGPSTTRPGRRALTGSGFTLSAVLAFGLVAGCSADAGSTQPAAERRPERGRPRSAGHQSHRPDRNRSDSDGQAVAAADPKAPTKVTAGRPERSAESEQTRSAATFGRLRRRRSAGTTASDCRSSRSAGRDQRRRRRGLPGRPDDHVRAEADERLGQAGRTSPSVVLTDRLRRQVQASSPSRSTARPGQRLQRHRRTGEDRDRRRTSTRSRPNSSAAVSLFVDLDGRHAVGSFTRVAR